MTKRRPYKYQNVRDAEIAAIVSITRNRAEKRSIEWALSVSDVEEIIFQNCFYCGIPPTQLKKLPHSQDGLRYNGIDRINNQIGYIKDNVVPCCGICNSAKNDLPLDKFREWAIRLATHLQRR